jgi:cytochrome c2
MLGRSNTRNSIEAKCVGCHSHGADVQKRRDAYLSGIITRGKGKMPPCKNVKADQVKHMDAFIRSLKR